VNSPLLPEDEVEYEVELGETFTNEESDRTYHTLHYGFRPPSVESQGKIFKAQDGSLDIEFKTTNAEQPTYFRAHYQRSNELECLLIYDPEEKTFTLEKLTGSAKSLKPTKGPPSVSPNAPLPVIPTVTNGSGSANHTVTKKRPSESQKPAKKFKREKIKASPQEKATDDDDDLENLISTIENSSNENAPTPSQEIKQPVVAQNEKSEPTQVDGKPEKGDGKGPWNSSSGSSSDSSSSSSDSSSSSSDSESDSEKNEKK